MLTFPVLSKKKADFSSSPFDLVIVETMDAQSSSALIDQAITV
jgi:hypothetical protein